VACENETGDNPNILEHHGNNSQRLNPSAEKIRRPFGGTEFAFACGIKFSKGGKEIASE
jgi:hypothetical protein